MITNNEIPADPVETILTAINALTDEQAEGLAECLWYAAAASNTRLYGRQIRVSLVIERHMMHGFEMAQTAHNRAERCAELDAVGIGEQLPDLPAFWARMDARNKEQQS